MLKNVLITGGGGYVGSVLVPKLLAKGHRVTVVDLFMYGEDVLDSVKGNPGLVVVKGDIRDRALVGKRSPGQDAVIHLACISNDPSYELDPSLGKSINYDAATQLYDLAAGRRREAVHLRLVLVGLRHQGGGERHRGPAPGAADRLLQVQGAVRAVHARAPPSGDGHADPAPGDRLRLLAPDAARPVGQHPDQPRRQQGEDHRLRRRAEAAQHPHRGHDRPVRRRAWSTPTRRSTGRSSTPATTT